MRPSIVDLEKWCSGSKDLVDLVDSLSLGPREVDLLEAVRRKLRDLDGHTNISTRIQEDISKQAPSSRMTSPRRKLQEVARTVFGPSEHGGMDYRQALEGLAMLEQVEKHRVLLVRDAKLAVKPGFSEGKDAKLLELLDGTATKHYAVLQWGFRAHCVRNFPPQGDMENPDETRIMAQLNALSPPNFIPSVVDEANSPHYTESLQDGIRLRIYEHLTKPNTTPQADDQSVYVKSSCSVPGYRVFRDVMLKYSQEFKKLEVLCLHILDQKEKRRATASGDQVLPRLLHNAASEGSKIPEIVQALSADDIIPRLLLKAALEGSNIPEVIQALSADQVLSGLLGNVSSDALETPQIIPAESRSLDARLRVHPLAIVPFHSRTVGSGSKNQHTRDSLISPALHARYLENDPSTSGHNASPTSQEAPTSPTAVPDSPTLGHENEGLEFIVEGRDAIHEQQSFDLLKTYMRSRRNRTPHPRDRIAPCTSAHRSAAKALDFEHPKVHWYSSSFALNKAKSHEAFTLLPQPSSTCNHVIHTDSQPYIGTLPPNFMSRKPARGRSMSEKSTALALQIFDTTSRLASVTNRRDSIISITPPPNRSDDGQTQSSTPKPSRLGHLFSRHIRSGSSASSTAEI
ncbi:uncharacterized protein MAM_01106 [Metarhizium album ARSEF 1941]|uniref:Uncharacterized protein n=1 Tax=Metarhizium album (strain ARSEF 1941) TaxID=1081103 RepID=A0A0B2X953_METAS|nr:uncharacterized protein MAM_01106 [Metarhizium album ARSEF 1941]KHO02105.1 hypothetical protein MAM_01106 [Metarhizium album ARSEF 1941]